MVNVDGSKRIWKQPEIKDIFEKCGAKKPDKATWGDVQYVFAMYYSDGFPKVFKCENELVKATLMYLDDPDYSSEQKEFLLNCFEENLSFEELARFASPALTVEQMSRLRRIYEKRYRT